MTRLGDQELRTELQNLDGWDGTSEGIKRTFQFKDFVTAVAFLNRAAEFAEAAQHHPDIDIRYNKVTLTLSTHDEGGVTEKDIALAQKLNAAA